MLLHCLTLVWLFFLSILPPLRGSPGLSLDIILHSNPYNLPLTASTYYSEDIFIKLFSAKPLTNTAWTGMTLSFPEVQTNKLIKALE